LSDVFSTALRSTAADWGIEVRLDLLI